MTISLFKKTLFKILIVSVVLSFLGFFFSYRLLEVPTGLTSDEAAFGYNAVLLSRSGHDENGNFLPIFVLSLNGRDWRQPVTQYYMAGFFKLFGASVFNLRLSSVVITLFSATLLFFLARLLINKNAAIFASTVFLLTPLVMIQSHMGLDNIMSIPFTIIWLLGLALFLKNGQRKYLILSAIGLGIGFYSYKGMRAVVPVWTILTILYLFVSNSSKSKFSLQTLSGPIIFILSILPFFAIIPTLEDRYPGAVFDRLQPVFSSVYDLIYYYFSYFDLTFLFIKGDALPYHSTGRHGMMLLASLPLFLIGCYRAIQKKNFWVLILLAFFSAPLLYGLATTAHRASRVMSVIPLYSLLATLGAATLWEFRKALWCKILLPTLVVLVILNYFDFTKYYWFTYPKATENIFGHLDEYQSFEALSKEAKARNLCPYISADLIDSSKVKQLFFESIYFPQGAKVLNPGRIPPDGSILMTNSIPQPEMEKVDLKLPVYHLQTRKK